MGLLTKRVGVVLKRSLGFILLLSISGASIALAGTLTFTGTSVTMTDFLGLLGGVVGIGATSTSATLYVQSQGVATTSLQVQGLAGQTARLFAVASSSGVNNFEILASGLASSTNFIAVNASTTNLDVSGYLTVLGQTTIAAASSSGNVTIGGTFQSNAGQNTLGNVSSTNLDVATRLNFVAASSTGNVTITGANTQITNQLTFANASSTNLDVATRLNFVAASSTGNVTITGANTQITNQLTFANASSTNLNVSGRLVSSGTSTFGGGSQIASIFCGHSYVAPTALATNATGTIGITLTGISTSTAQSFSMGINATSGYAYSLALTNVVPSSTANAVDLVIRNISTAANTNDKMLFTVCGMQS